MKNLNSACFSLSLKGLCIFSFKLFLSSDILCFIYLDFNICGLQMKENQLDSGYKAMEQPAISFKNRFEFLLNADIKVTRILCPCLWLSLHLPRIVCLFCFFPINFPCFPNNDYRSPTIHGIRLIGVFGFSQNISQEELFLLLSTHFTHGFHTDTINPGEQAEGVPHCVLQTWTLIYLSLFNLSLQCACLLFK